MSVSPTLILLALLYEHYFPTTQVMARGSQSLILASFHPSTRTSPANVSGCSTSQTILTNTRTCRNIGRMSSCNCSTDCRSITRIPWSRFIQPAIPGRTRQGTMTLGATGSKDHNGLFHLKSTYPLWKMGNYVQIPPELNVRRK